MKIKIKLSTIIKATLILLMLGATIYCRVVYDIPQN